MPAPQRAANNVLSVSARSAKSCVSSNAEYRDQAFQLSKRALLQTREQPRSGLSRRRRSADGRGQRDWSKG